MKTRVSPGAKRRLTEAVRHGSFSRQRSVASTRRPEREGFFRVRVVRKRSPRAPSTEAAVGTTSVSKRAEGESSTSSRNAEKAPGVPDDHGTTATEALRAFDGACSRPRARRTHEAGATGGKSSVPAMPSISPEHLPPACQTTRTETPHSASGE